MVGRTIVDLSLYKAQIITWFQDDNKTAKEKLDYRQSNVASKTETL